MNARPEKIRAFFAFALPQQVQRWIGENLIAPLSEVPVRAKWVEVKNIHLTVRFLGEVDPGKLGKLVDGIRRDWQSFGAIPLQLGKAGYFGRNFPRVVWVGLDGDLTKLGAVHDFVEKMCVEYGFGREDKPFSPHITLGRIKSPSQTGKLIAAIKKIQVPTVEFSLDELELFRSTLTPNGPIYEVMERFSL